MKEKQNETTVVNFTNIYRAAFKHNFFTPKKYEAQNSSSKSCAYKFCLKKAAHKMLVELTSGWPFCCNTKGYLGISYQPPPFFSGYWTFIYFETLFASKIMPKFVMWILWTVTSAVDRSVQIHVRVQTVQGT